MRAAHAAGLTAAGLWTRRPELPDRPHPAEFGQFFIDFDALTGPDCDLLILAVNDDQIGPLAERMAPNAGGLRASKTLVVHLSGSLTTAVLQPLADAGVAVAAAHPLRAFPDFQPHRDLAASYLALEGEVSDLPRLEQLAECLGMRTFVVPPEAKTAHHLAAACASNLIMLLMTAVDDLSSAAGIPESGRAAYLDLARRSLELQSELGPEALTGPWLRGDLGTLKRHLGALRAHPGIAGVYRAFGEFLLTKTGRIPEPEVFARELRRFDQGS